MVTNSSPLEYEIKKAAIDGSHHAYLMIDSSKYGKSGMLTYADLSEMKAVIVDEQVKPELLSLLEKKYVEAVIAPLSLE
jgi:DeoR family myo-inositol catabolism operon transcriptional repressor